MEYNLWKQAVIANTKDTELRHDLGTKKCQRSNGLHAWRTKAGMGRASYQACACGAIYPFEPYFGKPYHG